MRKTLILAAILLAAAGYLTYTRFLSTEAQIQRVANQFMQAAVAGDLARLEQLVTPDARVPAAQWVEELTGLNYFAQRAPVVPVPANSCGITHAAAATASGPAGQSYLATLGMKQLDGKWLVHQKGIQCGIPNLAAR